MAAGTNVPSWLSILEQVAPEVLTLIEQIVTDIEQGNSTPADVHAAVAAVRSNQNPPSQP